MLPKTILLSLLKKIFPDVFATESKKIYHSYLNPSYSHEGEYIVLSRFFNNKKKGFYIDVGAHHPYRFSNTFKFYQKGWSGINIDAMPGSMELFCKKRPRDINIETGISLQEDVLTYYTFNQPALNTFNKAEALLKGDKVKFYITGEKKVQTKPLSKVLKEHLPENASIDFMNVDVEGMDLEVLQSNDWSFYKPLIIAVEELRSDLETIISSSEIYKYLRGKKYYLCARTYNTSFYRLAVS